MTMKYEPVITFRNEGFATIPTLRLVQEALITEDVVARLHHHIESWQEAAERGAVDTVEAEVILAPLRAESHRAGDRVLRIRNELEQRIERGEADIVIDAILTVANMEADFKAREIQGYEWIRSPQ